MDWIYSTDVRKKEFAKTVSRKVVLSSSQENSTNFSSQNPSTSPNAMKLRLKPGVFQFKKHRAQVWLIFVRASWLIFMLFCVF
jgi:hypothetical protein